MEGIEYRHSKELIAELPGAYQDIDEVMESSRELVEIKHTQRQVVNVQRQLAPTSWSSSSRAQDA